MAHIFVVRSAATKFTLLLLLLLLIFCCVREFYRRIETERKDRIERTGDPSYTEFEALLPWLVSFLLPEKKCRAVMEYDPAADRIKFFQEDDPAGQ